VRQTLTFERVKYRKVRSLEVLPPLGLRVLRGKSFLRSLLPPGQQGGGGGGADGSDGVGKDGNNGKQPTPEQERLLRLEKISS
jgi:hypothetical protein